MAKKARNASQSNQTNHGAEWHRWDPHIHTKGTAKNDQFKSKSWEDFIEKFFRAALEHDVHAIGVTDYHSLDNYLKVLDYQENQVGRAVSSSRRMRHTPLRCRQSSPSRRDVTWASRTPCITR